MIQSKEELNLLVLRIQLMASRVWGPQGCPAIRMATCKMCYPKPRGIWNLSISVWADWLGAGDEFLRLEQAKKDPQYPTVTCFLKQGKGSWWVTTVCGDPWYKPTWKMEIERLTIAVCMHMIQQMLHNRYVLSYLANVSRVETLYSLSISIGIDLWYRPVAPIHKNADYWKAVGHCRFQPSLIIRNRHIHHFEVSSAKLLWTIPHNHPLLMNHHQCHHRWRFTIQYIEGY